MNKYNITIKDIQDELKSSGITANEVNQFNAQRIISSDHIYWYIEFDETECGYGRATNIVSLADAKKIANSKNQTELDTLLNDFLNDWDFDRDHYEIYTGYDYGGHAYIPLNNLIGGRYEDDLTDFQKNEAGITLDS